MTTQEGLPALATDAEIAALKAEWGPHSLVGRVLARLEAAESQVKELRKALVAIARKDRTGYGRGALGRIARAALVGESPDWDADIRAALEAKSHDD